jgi:hypothetical protein
VLLEKGAGEKGEKGQKPSKAKTILITILVAVLALAIGGLGLYLYLSKKAQRDADDAFTLVMNALAGPDMWERGTLKYDLLKRTLTVDKVVVRLSPNAPAVRIDVDQVQVKGAPDREEVEELLAVRAWVDKPETPLFDLVDLSGVTVQGARFKPIGNAAIKKVSASGAALAANGSQPNPFGTLALLSVKSLSLEGAEALVVDEEFETDVKIGAVKASDYRLEAESIKERDFWALVGSLRLAEYTVSDLDLKVRPNDGQKINITLKEQSFKDVSGFKYGSISYSGARIRLESADQAYGAFAGFDSGQVAGLDLYPIIEKFKGMDLMRLYDDPDYLASAQTVADVLTGTIGYESVQITNLLAGLDNEITVKMISAFNKGPFKPGRLPARAESNITGFSVTLHRGGILPLLDEARMIAGYLGLDSVTLNHDLKCDYQEGMGSLSCAGGPILALEGLFEQRLSFSLTGLTTALLDQLATLAVEDFSDIRYFPRASNLILSNLKIEMVNLGLVDKLYNLGNPYGFDKVAIQREMRGYVEGLLPLVARFDQIERLQEDLLAFIDSPKSITLEMRPKIPIPKLLSFSVHSDQQSFNEFGLSVSVNGRPQIPLTYGLGSRAPTTSELPPKIAPIEPAPPQSDPEAAARESARAQAEQDAAQKAAASLAEQEAILSLVLDKLFQPGRWQAGKTSLDRGTGTFVAEEISAQLPGDLTGPLSIGKISWTRAADHEAIWRVLFTTDWSNQPKTPLFDNLRLEAVSIPVSEAQASEGELRIEQIKVSWAQMAAGGPSVEKSAMGLWSHLVLGEIDVDNLALELLVDPKSNESIALSLANIGAASLTFGNNFSLPAGHQVSPAGPLEDTLGFIKGVAAEEARIGGLDLSAASSDGALSLKIGALSLNGLKNLAATHQSLDEVAFELSRLGNSPAKATFSLGRLDLAGIDLSELSSRFDPYYQTMISRGTRATEALLNTLKNIERHFRLFDAFSPPFALDSLDLERASFSDGRLVYLLDRLEATGPWRPGLLPAAQKLEFSGSVSLFGDPADSGEAPASSSPEALEAVLGGRSFKYSGRWLGVFDEAKNALTFSLSPLANLEGQAQIQAEIALQGVTKELVGFLHQIPVDEPERALYVPGFESLAVTSASLSLESPQIIKRLLAVAGSSQAAQDAAADRLSRMLVGALGPGAPGQALLIADLKEFLLKPDRILANLRPRKPFPLSSLIKSGADWRRVLDALDATVTVNRRTPLNVKTRAAE